MNYFSTRSWYLCIVVTSILLTSCNKERAGNSSNTDIDYTPLPSVQKVNTDLIGYRVNEQGNPVNEGIMYVNGSRYTIMGNGIIRTGYINTDPLNTLVQSDIASISYINKSFSFSDAIKNYFQVKIPELSSIGNVMNNEGGTFALPGNGSLTFGISTLYNPPDGIVPGYYSGYFNGDIYAKHLDPENAEFALLLPASFGDDKQQRWFLKSYGAVLLSSRMKLDFYNGKTAHLKLPISTSMLTDAPDSVATWKWDNGAWTKAGIAKKTGNFYETDINSITNWNIAVPVKGVYLTVHLQTDNKATLTNTTIRIKSNNYVLTEAQTDADGNTTLFVPSNEVLTADILPPGFVQPYTQASYNLSVGKIDRASAITLTMPSSTPELSTLFGSVYDCNGELLKSGMARISTWGDHETFVPVVNGHFATAIWNIIGYDVVPVQITDFSTNSQGEIIKTGLPGSKFPQQVNFYTCQNSPLLYCNYSVDDVSYALQDNANASSVYMTGNKMMPGDNLSIKTNNVALKQGINFERLPNELGYYYNIILTNVVVNGVAYQQDTTKESLLAYNRVDSSANGYIEGYFSFYYKDNAGVSHYVQGNFKVKKTY